MICVRPSRFRGISSDSTGNTSSGRTLTKDDFPWIIILPDSCHCMDKLCKDISKINYFQPVSLSLHVQDSLELCCNKAYLQTIQKIRAGVKHFKKSTFATAHLRIQRRQLRIKQGLVSVGKTRF